MSTESYKHKDKRKHIPSKEEEGYEKANPVVSEKTVSSYPKNPVVHRGQDPELMWMNKYGSDDRDDMLNVDIRSLYRHEHISPEVLIRNLYRLKEEAADPYQLDMNELFGNSLAMDELEKVGEYYRHQDGWSNRMILGDSLLVMNSLLEREGMAGKVQMIYIDPPYGIKYGGNWQMKLNDRTVKDGSDDHLTGEPEMVKAYRDTWELGIHSYLSYLRERLLVAKELLSESGSCFVQISDDNIHLVRCLLDEIFGATNFVRLISFKTTSGFKTRTLTRTSDYIIWYCKEYENLKYRQLFLEKKIAFDNIPVYKWVELKDGSIRKISVEESIDVRNLPEGARVFRIDNLTSQGQSKFNVEFDGKNFSLRSGLTWKTHEEGMRRLINKNRIAVSGKSLAYKRYLDDFPINQLEENWNDTITGSFTEEKKFVVHTSPKVILRCLLMTTDPGDLVLDPTCGSGTTAYVAEQWGRRWITIDTSRIALNIAKTRLMTAKFPYYKLYDESFSDIRQGFIYKKVPHITLKSIANDEPPEEETLYDQPEVDNSKMRVSGPFTVETLQNFNPIPPEEAEESYHPEDNFEEKVFEHLKTAGVKTGMKEEKATFVRIDPLQSEYLHAEGFYGSDKGEKKAYIHIGPKFGTVSKTQVNEAIKECRQRGDADWLVILGFSFESNIQSETVTASMGAFQVTKVRMHDDLMQDGLLKKDKKAASFVTIGEPDIRLSSDEWLVTSDGKILCNYGIFKKLSGIDSLAKINGLDTVDLQTYICFSQRRDVWIDIANAQGIRFNFSEYRRRVGAELHGGIYSVLGNSERFFGGAGDFDHFMSEIGISDPGKWKQLIDEHRGDKQNADRIKEIAVGTPLATRHYSLATIRGLDIYDPIKDEVKARNVHDIAYWVVDDDYDGSNFVVKQVFFCGGNKDEFKKWQKGLDDMAKRSARRKAEKTLKIEIDDEAFDRIYGHISHPIPHKKGKKIAVRVISQFGEESMKVLEV